MLWMHAGMPKDAALPDILCMEHIAWNPLGIWGMNTQHGFEFWQFWQGCRQMGAVVSPRGHMDLSGWAACGIHRHLMLCGNGIVWWQCCMESCIMPGGRGSITFAGCQ